MTPSYSPLIRGGLSPPAAAGAATMAAHASRPLLVATLLVAVGATALLARREQLAATPEQTILRGCASV